MSPRRAAFVRRALTALASTVAALAGAKIVVRAWLAARGTPYDARAAADALRALESTVRGSTTAIATHGTRRSGTEHVLQPYYGVDQAANVDRVEEEAARFRSGAYADAFVVVVLGGSVAAIAANEAGERITAPLAREPRLASKRVVLIPQARGAFKQPQQLSLLGWLLALGWRPDAVVEIDGFNEVAIATENRAQGFHPAYPGYDRWSLLASGSADRSRELEIAAEILARRDEVARAVDGVLARGLERSAVLGTIAWRRASRAKRAWNDAHGRMLRLLAGGDAGDPVRGPAFRGDARAGIELAVDAWAECSRSIAATCRERGVVYLHVLQPTLHDPGAKPATQAELANGAMSAGWTEGVVEGYPRLRARGAELARLGVDFVDLSRVFAGTTESVYVDACHFRGAGLALFADRVGEELARAVRSAPPR